MSVRRLALIVIVLCVWEAVRRFGLVGPLLLASPSEIVGALIKSWPEYLDALRFTFLEIALALAIAWALGIATGVVAGMVPFLNAAAGPLLSSLFAVPLITWYPLFMVWCGIGISSKIALAFILVAVLIFFTVYTGILQVDKRLVERITTLGGGRWALIRYVYLPSVASWILSNMKVAVGFAFTGAVVGEFVAASRGLGYLLSFAQSTYNAALMLALVMLIMAVVLVIFYLSGRLEKRLTRWN